MGATVEFEIAQENIRNNSPHKLPHDDQPTKRYYVVYNAIDEI